VSIERALRHKERDDKDKIPQDKVDFESPSEHDREECEDCTHFIFAKPPRCENIKGPILFGDWCKNFDRR
jgi:hypothetical protein